MSFTLVCVFINPIHKEQYDWEMVVNYAHTSRGCTISDAENNHYQACPTFNSSLQSFQGSYECSPTQLFPLLFIYLFFIQYILIIVSTPSTLPSTSFPYLSSPLQNHSSSISLQKRASIPGILTKHTIKRYNKTRHKPLYQSWMRQHSRKKRDSRAGQRVRDTPTFTLWSSTRTLS